jgi:hypothetical protein
MNKVESLNYGFVSVDAELPAPVYHDDFTRSVPQYNIFLDSPSEVFDQVLDTYIGDALGRCNPIVSHYQLPDNAGERLVINLDGFKRIDGNHPRMQRVTAASNVMKLLDNFYNPKIVVAKDPKIEISRTGIVAEGRTSGMHATVLWPEAELASDELLSQIASERMVAAAKAFEYKTQHETESLVFARVKRNSGVSLHVDSDDRPRMFSTAVFHANETSFQLVENSLIKDFRRLFCLAGAVAIAHADQLLPKAPESDTVTE